MLFQNTFNLNITSPNLNSIKYFKFCLITILNKNNILNLNLTDFNFPLKIKKFTVLKSPHVYKTARTQLEIRTLKTTLKLQNLSQRNIIHVQKFFKFFKKNLFLTLEIKIKQKKLYFI